MSESTSQPVSAGPASEISRRHTGRATAVVLFSAFVGFIALTSPAAVNGLIQGSLHASGAQLTWIVDIFFIPTASLELTFGVVGDRLGRKRLMLVGAFLLIVGDGIGAVATNVGALMAGQAVAGIGTAAILPTSLATVAVLTPGTKSRARGVTLWALSLSMGAAVGPLVSGALGLHYSFHYAFLLPCLLACVLAVMAVLWMPESRAPTARKVDLPGQVTFAVGLTAVLYGVIEGSSTRWGNAPIVAALTCGVLLLVAFVGIEIRTPHSLVNTDLFKSITYSGAVLIGLVGAIGFFGFQYLVTVRVAVIQGQDSLHTGSVAASQIIGQLVLWPLLVRALQRVRPRYSLTLGLLLLGTAQLWVSLIGIENRSLLALFPAMVLSGLGFICTVSATAAAVVDVPPEAEGVASGTINMARDTGAAAGVAILGAFALSRAAAALPGHIAGAGLPASALAIVNHVASAGGAIAVAHAPLGALSARSMAAGQEALWDGFSVAMKASAVLSLVSIALTLILIRAKAPMTVFPESPAGDERGEIALGIADGTQV